MKKLVFPLIAAFLIVTGIFVTKSYATDPLIEIQNKYSFENAAEKEVVNALFEKDIPIAKKLINQDPNFLPKEYAKKQLSKMGKPYKVYFVHNDFTQRYQENNSFNDTISKEYLWEVPLLDEEVEVISTTTAWNNKGKWEIAQTGLNIPAQLVKLSASPQSISELLTKNELTKAKDIKHVRILRASMDALYILSESGEEYIVPMTHRPDLVGLENLKIYNATELMQVLEDRFPPITIDESGLIRF